MKKQLRFHLIKWLEKEKIKIEKKKDKMIIQENNADYYEYGAIGGKLCAFNQVIDFVKKHWSKN